MGKRAGIWSKNALVGVLSLTVSLLAFLFGTFSTRYEVRMKRSDRLLGEFSEYYDYIVVGSGPGGGHAAGKLVKQGFKVLLLDAGKDYSDSNVNYTAPIFNPQSAEDEETALNYWVEYNENRTKVLYPRAAALGGCLVHHALITSPIFTSVDFSSIAELTGDNSWSTENMQGYWMGIEDSYQYPPEYNNPCDHGFRGPIPTFSVTVPPPELDPRALLPQEAMTRMGWPRINKWNDSNCAPHRDNEGTFTFSNSITARTGIRNSTRTYLKQLQQQYPNTFHIRPDSLVSKILFNGNIAVGVEVWEGPHLNKASPKFREESLQRIVKYQVLREIVIAGGTFESPKLLQNSGIGPPELLKSLNVTMLSERPGVGQNLQDRYEVSNAWKLNPRYHYQDLCRTEPAYCHSSWKLYGNFSQWALNGPLVGIKAKTNKTFSEPNVPDLILFGGASYFNGYYPGFAAPDTIRILNDTFTFLSLKAYAQNRAGSVESSSADPREPPTINFRQFAEGEDQDIPALIQGVRWMRELANRTNELARERGLLIGDYLMEEILPGKDVQSDADLEAWIRDVTWGHHACCSNKIGDSNDLLAVVDSRLRVYGARNLRVSDASVFPNIPGYFISVPLYVLGEKAGDMISEDSSEACKVNPVCSETSTPVLAIVLPIACALIVLVVGVVFMKWRKEVKSFDDSSIDIFLNELAKQQGETSEEEMATENPSKSAPLDLEKERAFFKELDQNGAEGLQFDDFHDILKNDVHTKHISEDDARKIFSEIDFDEEKGTINFEEWINFRMLMRHSKERASRKTRSNNLSFANISCFYPQKSGKPKQVLHNLKGTFPAGSLTALMGPSGAGKSTFLDILAMRKSTGIVVGSILVGDNIRDATFPDTMAYVTQEDLFPPKLTVMETVRYYANLRLSSNLAKSKKLEICKHAIAIVGLAPQMNNYVGGPLPGGISVRGLSGGQKRRLSVACALVSNPSFMFLDEPTSGLDSFSALMVMKLMKRLAHNLGITITCTIHQPRDIIWQMFDNVCLTAMGKLLYMGNIVKAVDWFRSLGYDYEKATNPADWILDLVSTNFEKDPSIFGDKTMKNEQDIAEAAEKFARHQELDESVLLQRHMQEIDRALQSKEKQKSGEKVSRKLSELLDVDENSFCPKQVDPANVNFPRQFLILLTRHLRNSVRNPGAILARVGVLLITGLATGWAYFDLPETLDNVNSRAGVLYFLAFIYIVIPFCQLGLFLYDRQFYAKEIAAKMYKPLPYYLAIMTFETVFNFVNVIISATIVFWMVGLGTRFDSRGQQYGQFILIIAILHTVGVQWVQVCALSLPNQDTAFAVGAGFLVMMQLVAGFLVRSSELQPSFAWLQWISYLKYGWNALMRVEFTQLDNNMDSSLQILGPDFFDLNGPNDIYTSVGVLFGFWLVFNILGFLSLAYLHKERR